MKTKVNRLCFWVEKELQFFDFDEILYGSGHTIMDVGYANFPNDGHSGFYILGESHFATHYWPEKNVTYCELSTCLSKKSVAKFIALCKKKYKLLNMERSESVY